MNTMLYTVEPAERGSAGVLYGTVQGPTPLAELAEYLPRGTLVALRPTPAAAWGDVRVGIENVARRIINAPMVLWPDCVGRARSVEYAAKARSLGMGGLIWNREPTRKALREQLTDSEDWPQFVVLWLRRRGLEFSPRAEYLLTEVARHALAHPTLTALAAKRGLDERQWRRLFAAESIAPPARWHGALRLVAIGREIQRVPGTVSRTAFRYGYSGAAALSDRLNEVIGARPTYIRHHLGWPWMLADALKRAGIM